MLFIDRAYYLYRKENTQPGLWAGSYRDPLKGAGDQLEDT
jgi:hypothetical protein